MGVGGGRRGVGGWVGGLFLRMGRCYDQKGSDSHAGLPN